MALLKKTEEHKTESFHYEVDKSLKITSATKSSVSSYGSTYGRSSTPKATIKKITIYFKDGKFDKVSALGTSVPNRQTWKLYKEIETEISRIEKEIDLRDAARIVEESVDEKVMGSKMIGIIKKGKADEDSL